MPALIQPPSNVWIQTEWWKRGGKWQLLMIHSPGHPGVNNFPWRHPLPVGEVIWVQVDICNSLINLVVDGLKEHVCQVLDQFYLRGGYVRTQSTERIFTELPYLDVYKSVSGYDPVIPNATFEAEWDPSDWPRWTKITNWLVLRVTSCDIDATFHTNDAGYIFR